RPSIDRHAAEGNEPGDLRPGPVAGSGDPATTGVIPPQPDAGMARKWERSTPPRAWTSGDRNWCATLFPWNGATSGRRRFHACIGLDRRRFLQASSSPARLRKLAGTQEGRSRRDVEKDDPVRFQPKEDPKITTRLQDVHVLRGVHLLRMAAEPGIVLPIPEQALSFKPPSGYIALGRLPGGDEQDVSSFPCPKLPLRVD